MKRYIRAYKDYPNGKYPWGSPELKDKVQEHMQNLQEEYSDATVQAFNSIIYVISPEVGVSMFVVDEWGHCGKIYGGFFDYVQDYLKDGGDINLVTFTDKLGNVYTPYKNRKSINVTFPNGSSVDMSRDKAAGLYLKSNQQGIYSPNFWKKSNPIE